MSRARCDFGEADRKNIVQSSIRNNAAADVTGLLLSDGARFVQAIEGDDNEIDECFDRIRSDHRHYDLVVFDNGRIDKREFGKWSLNSRHQADLDIMQFRSAVAYDVRDVSDVRLKAMFIGFASLAR